MCTSRVPRLDNIMLFFVKAAHDWVSRKWFKGFFCLAYLLLVSVIWSERTDDGEFNNPPSWGGGQKSCGGNSLNSLCWLVNTWPINTRHLWVWQTTSWDPTGEACDYVLCYISRLISGHGVFLYAIVTTSWDLTDEAKSVIMFCVIFQG